MKIFLFVAALTFSLMMSAQTEAASEEYLGEWEGGWKAYLIVNSMELLRNPPNAEVACKVKAVSPRGTVKYINYDVNLTMESADKVLVDFTDSLGGRGRFYFGNPGVYQVEQELAKFIMAGLVYAMDYAKRQR